MRIALAQGDITGRQVGAIVNAANSSLLVLHRIAPGRGRTRRAHGGLPRRVGGIYGWPPDDAARIAVTTVYAANHPTLTEARFVFFVPDIYGHFR